MTKQNRDKFLNNLLKFTAVFLAALFSQLALGITLKQAIPFAMVILYGALADFCKKLI